MRDDGPAVAVDEYVASAPPGARQMLEELRALLWDVLPDAEERISYGIPTFDLGGKHVVHFAGYANHLGFYPTPSGMQEFQEELRPYLAGKGSLRFPLDQPLPLDLIRRVVEFRVEEVRKGA